MQSSTAAIRRAIAAFHNASRAAFGAGSFLPPATRPPSTCRSCSRRNKKHTRRANPRDVVAASRKPGSVARFGHPFRAGGHSSGTSVTERLVQPTQGLGRAALERPSTWPCSGWGLPCRNRYRLRGGLLLHLFTLTRGACAARAV